MNKLILIYSLLTVLILTNTAIAQQGKFEVLGYYGNQEAPLPLAKKNKTGQMIYDSRVFGSPRFFQGHIITIAGEKIEGRIAVFGNSKDWNFVKRALLIIPEGQKVAQYLGSGTAVEIFQKKKKEEVYFDYYDGAYLQRLVSGRLTLSYNPAANTSRKTSSFISKSFLDSVRVNVIRQSVKNDLTDGKTLQQNLEKAKLKNDAINAFSEVEIVQKEYLLYDTDGEETIHITKANYAAEISKIMAKCSGLSQKDIKKYRNSYKSITDAIRTINANCR